MASFVALLRGINVGGKNMIRMTDLATCFRDAGYGNVQTFIQSGNVLFTAEHDGGLALEEAVEDIISQQFNTSVVVLIRSRDELAAIVADAPTNHGADDLLSDVFFLKNPDEVDQKFRNLPQLRQEVDSAAKGPGVIYFSRVAAQAAKSSIARIRAGAAFREMTVRNWRTTTRLLQMLDAEI